MSPQEPDVRWTGSSDPLLQEVAAALGTGAELILTVTQAPGGPIVVLFTPGYPTDQALWAAVLRAEADQQLVELLRQPWQALVLSFRAAAEPPEEEP